MEEFDFLVVGTGSGLDVANVAVNQGQSVAIVEKGPVGGTCLNRGCIPSKLLLYHADVMETVQRADEFNIDVSVENVDFGDIVREVNDEVSSDADSIEDGLQSSSQHELYRGEAQFVDEKAVEVVGGEDDGARMRAETILLAAGSRPSIPPIDGIESVDYTTSRDALELESLPDSLVIVGGGYIAAEMAHFFGTFGSEVTIIGRRPELLPAADEDVAAFFTEEYSERFTVHTGHSATAVSESEGEITVEARPYEYGEGGGIVEDADPVTTTGDELLVAAGRTPNSDTLELEHTDVRTDERGFIETDEYLQTDADGIWALGDIVGEYLLKHNANHEARIVTRNIFTDSLQAVDYTAMPYAVFASPEVAGVGATEGELRDEGREYATNTYNYRDTARGDAMKRDGLVKVNIDPEGEILGCHIVGPDASTLIQEVVVAMKSGSGTVGDIQSAVHIHPALPEVVDRAFAGQFTRGGDGHHN